MFVASEVQMEANLQNRYESGYNVPPCMDVYCENLPQSDNLKILKRL